MGRIPWDRPLAGQEVAGGKNLGDSLDTEGRSACATVGPAAWGEALSRFLKSAATAAKWDLTSSWGRMSGSVKIDSAMYYLPGKGNRP